MLKELYLKPQMRSETLEPSALCCTGTPPTCHDKDWLSGYGKASVSVCCEEFGFEHSTWNPCKR
jgi:hypothetical protein